MKKEKTIKAYKAFNPDFTCNGFQYKVGEEYSHDGEIKVCRSGFHACQNPLDVLSYYPLVDYNCKIARFAEVLQSGVIDNSEKDKTCSSKIKVEVELNLAGFIEAAIEEFTNPDKIKTDNSDYDPQIFNSRDYAQIVSSINNSQIVNNGEYAKIYNNSDYNKIANRGLDVDITNSGSFVQIANIGSRVNIASTGFRVNIANSGYGASICNSGYDANIVNNGNYARICSSGNYTKINSSGGDSIICCVGSRCAVKAKIGSWVTLAEWEHDEDELQRVPKCVKTEYVDGVHIKGDTWYQLINGEFVEQENSLGFN